MRHPTRFRWFLAGGIMLLETLALLRGIDGVAFASSMGALGLLFGVAKPVKKCEKCNDATD